MYLRYVVEPHFLKQAFTVHHPVGSVEESDKYVQLLLKKQGEGKTYSGFTLTDITKKNVVKLYRKITKGNAPRIVHELLRKKVNRVG